MIKLIEPKIERDLREIEYLVFQIKYFAESSPSLEHTTPMIKNLSKQILKFLKIEMNDITHIFLHEKKHWNKHKPYVGKIQLKSLTESITKSDANNIKKAVIDIVTACDKAVAKKINVSSMRTAIEKSCSKILKILKSEHHELELIKRLL